MIVFNTKYVWGSPLWYIRRSVRRRQEFFLILRNRLGGRIVVNYIGKYKIGHESMTCPNASMLWIYSRKNSGKNST